ncbi:hypothetical protein GCM10011586_28900 [Silvibacterium dinghuense]|nr:hypothetical protein GCM10011586_28900 [Silvibacterium dinghuense]
MKVSVLTLTVEPWPRCKSFVIAVTGDRERHNPAGIPVDRALQQKSQLVHLEDSQYPEQRVRPRL